MGTRVFGVVREVTEDGRLVTKDVVPMLSLTLPEVIPRVCSTSL